MKFGEHLQKEIFPPWKLSYMSYDMLKKELKSTQLDHEWNDQDEDQFIIKLENELEKVYDFVTAKLGEVEARISYCERTIQTFINNPSWSSDENWTIMSDALTEVLFDVNDLAKFTRLNFIGFQKILKKHDKWTGLDLQHDFIPQLRYKPLDKQRFDVAIVFISALHDLCRQKGRPRPTSAEVVVRERATAKYWIHPDNITEVKSIIMLHLPVSIYNKNKRYEPSDSAVSSVYLDNDDFSSYTGRLQRDDGSQGIRLRWYGPTSVKDIFVERSSQMDGNSTKDRIQIHSEDVLQFINGSLNAEQFANRLRAKNIDPSIITECQAISESMQKSIVSRKLRPVCRVFYNRTAFQVPDDPRVRISIDNDLTFIREDVHRDVDHWRRPDVGIDSPFLHVDESELLRFPYAVMETKLQPGQPIPAWLTKLVESHLVHEVPRFSKYLHGASYLFRDRLPLLPWWLSEMEVDIRKPRASNFGLTRSQSFKPLVDGKYRRAMEKEAVRMEIIQEVTNTRESLEFNDQNPFGESEELLAESNNEKSRDWGNRPHRMQSTLVTRGEDPLNYGPIREQRIKKKKLESGDLGEPLAFAGGDIRLDIEPGSDHRRLRAFFGDASLAVQDPNNPNATIAIKKVKVEPKVFFSNERTFISWLQFCALLLTVALNLLNFGDDVSRIAGAIFIGISAGIAIYALYQFEKRAWYGNLSALYFNDFFLLMIIFFILIG
jgi:SPX domain protein involved in polyphosphate accumulation